VNTRWHSITYIFNFFYYLKIFREQCFRHGWNLFLLSIFWCYYKWTFLIYFLNSLLLTCRSITDFCTFILYPALIFLTNFDGVFGGFFVWDNQIMSSEKRDKFSFLRTLASNSSIILNRSGEVGILILLLF
jgi:hypothetical protein